LEIQNDIKKRVKWYHSLGGTIYIMFSNLLFSTSLGPIEFCTYGKRRLPKKDSMAVN